MAKGKYAHVLPPVRELVRVHRTLVRGGWTPVSTAKGGRIARLCKGDYRLTLSCAGQSPTVYLYPPAGYVEGTTFEVRPTWVNAWHLPGPGAARILHEAEGYVEREAHWTTTSGAHRGAAYEVRAHKDDGVHPDGFCAFIGNPARPDRADLIGWAPTVSDARDLCHEWEHSSDD